MSSNPEFDEIIDHAFAAPEGYEPLTDEYIAQADNSDAEVVLDADDETRIHDEIVIETPPPVEEDGPLFEAKSVSHRTLLWGRVGKIFAEAPRTAEDAIEEAGLGWDVELRKLGYHNDKGNFVTAPKNFATVRTDTDALLGTVKSRYQPISNRDAFDMANILVDDYDASIEAAFETHGGKVVGLTMRLPEQLLVGGEESFSSYLAMRTTHDGSGSLRFAICQQRMACLNQFDFIINSAKNRFNIHHTAAAGQQIAQAREALELTFKYQDEFQVQVEQMMNETITATAAKKKMSDILASRRFGENATEKIVNAVEQNLAYSTTIPDDHRNTAFGWMNASTEYWEHIRSYRTDQSRYLVNSEGPGYHVRNEFARELLAV